MHPMRFASSLPSAVLLTAGLLLGCASMGFAQSTSTTAAPTADAPARAPQKVINTKPEWQDLTAAQKQALAPLTKLWPSMTEAHKRKWLALSQNFAQLPEADKNTLQSRMREWAALSSQQRAQARLNFADAKQLPQDERRSKWEAYQALSPEEKQKLAAQKPVAKVGAALAPKPVSAEKLAAPPTASGNKALPRIASDQAARTTLLPNTAAAPASVAPVSAETENPTSEQ
ncbi:MAG: hypothetical protein RI902_1403 [Pseudomonadota bacterium]